MKKILAIILIFLLFLILISGWWKVQSSPVNSDTSTKIVVIPKGEGISGIAKRLKDEGLIYSELVFKIYAKQNNLASKIQAGSFKLSSSMSLSEIADALTFGTDDVWVTLIEGWRVEEMGEKLNRELKIDPSASLRASNGQFLKLAKEGYMFPDTYLFPKDATTEYIEKILRDNFDRKYSDDLKKKIKDKGLTEQEGVILASLVEREGRSDKVRTEVAGILLKRLNIGMKLDVDATVQYALGYQKDEKSWWKRHITKEDKEIKSPYNTYKNPGLPPAPICNPSLSSLEAVASANPNTPYLYYYHDSKGNSHYAKTLDEHLENVSNNP